MKNCKGFTLIEVMTSLMVLSISTTILVPILVLIYNERISLQQEQTALHLLDEVITDWLYKNKEFSYIEAEVEKNPTNYKFSFHIDTAQKLTACISWLAANGRKYERCECGKK